MELVNPYQLSDGLSAWISPKQQASYIVDIEGTSNYRICQKYAEQQVTPHFLHALNLECNS